MSHQPSPYNYCPSPLTQRRLPKTHIAEEASFCRLLWRPQTREYIDWRWPPLSCVHSMMMVFVAQLADGGVHHALPLSSYLPPPLELRRPLHPLPSKTSKILLHVHKSIARLPFSLVETPALIEIECVVETAKMNFNFLHIILHN